MTVRWEDEEQNERQLEQVNTLSNNTFPVFCVCVFFLFIISLQTGAPLPVYRPALGHQVGL